MTGQSQNIGVPVSLVGEVLACIGEESGSTTNCGESGKATLDDVQTVFTVVVPHVGMTYAILSENLPELEEAVSWVLEARLHLFARIHLIHKLASLHLRP